MKTTVTLTVTEENEKLNFLYEVEGDANSIAVIVTKAALSGIMDSLKESGMAKITDVKVKDFNKELN